MKPTPFHEGLWAWVGGRSPGSRAYPSTPSQPAAGGSVAAHSWRAAVGIPGHSGGSAPDSHRLPFTTDHMNAWILLHSPRGWRSDTARADRSVRRNAKRASGLRSGRLVSEAGFWSRLAGDAGEIGGGVVQGRALGLVEHDLLGEQAPRVVEVL